MQSCCYHSFREAGKIRKWQEGFNSKTDILKISGTQSFLQISKKAYNIFIWISSLKSIWVKWQLAKECKYEPLGHCVQ